MCRAGAERVPAGRVPGAAARVRQRAEPRRHGADAEPVHSALPGHDRAAGAFRRGRRGVRCCCSAPRRRRWRRLSGTRRQGCATGVQVPVYVCWVAPRGADGHAALLQEATLPSFHGPKRTAPAGGVAVRCGPADGPGGHDRLRFRASRTAGRHGGHRTGRPTASAPAAAAGSAARPRAARLPRHAGAAGWHRDTVIETTLCGNAAAAAAADHLGYPVVLEVAHPSITHKSEWARPSDPGWPGWCPGRDPAGRPAGGRAG
jgi:hypothetical protein